MHPSNDAVHSQETKAYARFDLISEDQVSEVDMFTLVELFSFFALFSKQKPQTS